MVDADANIPKNQRVFTRQQLYELVWKQPVRDVAAVIGISDVALAKACQRLNIPLPRRGYWAKIAAGHRLDRIPLLPDTLGRSEVRFDPRAVVKQRVPIERLAQASSVDRGSTTATPLQVSIDVSDLSKPHLLTRRARSGLKKDSADRRGLRGASPAIGWNVAVSEATIDRALVLVDSVCVALKKMGAVIRDGPKEPWQDESPKGVYLDDEPLHFAIREHVRQHRRTAKDLAKRKAAGDFYPHAYDFQPTGNLIVSLPNAPYGTIREWRDTKAGLLEGQLSAIVAGLGALPTVFRNERREKAEAEKRCREEERKRWEIEAREQRNKDRLAELLTEARTLADQSAITAYLDHLEREVAKRGYTVTDKLTQGLAKARNLAAKLDPTDRRVAILQNCGLVTESESRYYRESDHDDA